MTSKICELDRLAALGWPIPERDPRGVYVPSGYSSEAISYPETGFELLSLDTGSGYWFDHRANEVISEIVKHGVKSIWDIGAGTGSVATRIARSGIDVVAVEPVPSAAIFAAEAGLTVIQGSLGTLTLPNCTLESVGLFDVLEHLAKPEDLLHEVARVIQPNGCLFVTVPAHPFLWSDEDDVSGHFRRYTRKSLVVELESCGFTSLSVNYLFASLVPIASFARALPYALGRRRTEEKVFQDMAEQLKPSSQIDRFARMVLERERTLSKRLRLPFGLSLLGVFRRSI